MLHLNAPLFSAKVYKFTLLGQCSYMYLGGLNFQNFNVSTQLTVQSAYEKRIVTGSIITYVKVLIYRR